MTSTADIGDRIRITSTEHAWNGYKGTVVTRSRYGVGVHLDNGPIPAVGIFVHDSQYAVVRQPPNWRRERFYTSVRIPPAYAELFPPPRPFLNSLVEEKVDQMTPYAKNTVAWIRLSKNGEWMLAIAQDNAWHYMLATNDRITGSISPLSAPRDVVVIPRPGDAPIPDVLDDWWCEADQSELLKVIGERLEAEGHLADYSSLGINVHQPWRARVRKTGTVDEVINFDNAEKAEIITAFEARSK